MRDKALQLVFSLLFLSQIAIGAETKPVVIDSYSLELALSVDVLAMSGSTALIHQCETTHDECDVLERYVETGEYRNVNSDGPKIVNRQSVVGDLSGIAVGTTPRSSAYLNLDSGVFRDLDLKPRDFHLRNNFSVIPNKYWGGKALFYHLKNSGHSIVGFQDVQTWNDYELFSANRIKDVCGVLSNNRVAIFYADPHARLAVVEIDAISGAVSVVEYDIDFPDTRNTRNGTCISDGNTIFLAYSARIPSIPDITYSPLLEIDLENERYRRYSTRTFNSLLNGRINSDEGEVWLTMDVRYGNTGSAGGRTYKITDLYGTPKITDSGISLGQIVPSDDLQFGYSTTRYRYGQKSAKTVYFYDLPDRLVNDTLLTEIDIQAWEPLVRMP